MSYEVPQESFNALEHAKNKVLRANQLQDTVLVQFKESYHDFWGVTNPPTGSRYTTQEMQAIIDVMPTTVIDILTDAAEFYNYIVGAYPDSIESKYSTAAFNYTIGENGLIVSDLKEDWAAPVEPAPE